MTAQDQPYHPADIQEPDGSDAACGRSQRRGGRPSEGDGLRVTDDWPRPTPIAPREIVVIETYLSALLDELLGSKNR